MSLKVLFPVLPSRLSTCLSFRATPFARTRLLSLLALTASVLPLATATSNGSCKTDSQFNYLGFCIDLDINGNADCKGTAP